MLKKTLASALLGIAAVAGIAAQAGSAMAGPGPSVWTAQPPYAGDCKHRPAGTVCIKYSDGYVWLVGDSITGWSTEPGAGFIFVDQVAHGVHFNYHHELFTSLVKVTP